MPRLMNAGSLPVATAVVSCGAFASTDCWTTSDETVSCCESTYPSVYRGPACGGSGSTPEYCGLKFDFPEHSDPRIHILEPAKSGETGGPRTSFTETQVDDCVGKRGWCIDGECVWPDHPNNWTDFWCGTWSATGPTSACP